MYREADGPDDVRRAVREQLRYGADFVKVMTTGARSVELEDPDPAQLTREELAVFVEEAHRMGYRVAAHCEGLAGTALAIEARGRHDRARHVPQPAARPARADGREGQVLVPTLSCFYCDGRLGHRSGRGPRAPTWTPLLVELGKHNLEQAGLTLRRGADAAGPARARARLAPLHAGLTSSCGWSHHGLTRRRGARRGDRRRAAVRARPRGHVGTVEPGKLADLLSSTATRSPSRTLLRDRRGSGSCSSSARPSPERRSKPQRRSRAGGAHPKRSIQNSATSIRRMKATSSHPSAYSMKSRSAEARPGCPLQRECTPTDISLPPRPSRASSSR